MKRQPPGVKPIRIGLKYLRMFGKDHRIILYAAGTQLHPTDIVALTMTILRVLGRCILLQVFASRGQATRVQCPPKLIKMEM